MSEDVKQKDRASFYIDGFNLYHAVDDLGQPHYKWLSLRALALRLLSGKPETLVRIVYCTAFRNDMPEKLIRHRVYVRALEADGVIVRKGYFGNDKRECHKCGYAWDQKVEKEGDVSLALALLDDAYQDLFDVAYLVTADGDQAPTIRTVRDRFPNKKIVSVCPPGREHNFKLRDLASGIAKLTETAIESCLLPKMMMSMEQHALIRPTEYDPPPGWLPPNQRPAKK